MPRPMFTPSDPDRPPFEWVQILAATIDRWVQNPAVRRRFLAEYERSTSAEGQPGWLRGAALTLSESFTLLMAVHDKYADAERLLPESDGADPATVARNMAHVACMAHLARQLKTQPGAARDMLCDALCQVVAALKLPLRAYCGAAEALGLERSADLDVGKRESGEVAPRKRKPGRPRVDERLHKRIIAAWGDGKEYPTYEECARKLADVKAADVARAVNREAKRRARPNPVK